MTDEQLDTFLIETLKKILVEMKEWAAYTKDIHSEEYDEINEEYQASIENLTNTLNSINGLDDLAELDEDDVDLVYSYLEGWYDNYIISANPDQKKKDLLECAKLEELMDLFLDVDDEDYEEDSEE